MKVFAKNKDEIFVFCFLKLVSQKVAEFRILTLIVTIIQHRNRKP